MSVQKKYLMEFLVHKFSYSFFKNKSLNIAKELREVKLIKQKT